MRRILLFVNYNQGDTLENRTAYSLKYLKKLYDEIVVISNSKLSKVDEAKIKGLSGEIIYRKNSGYDFAAWRDGIKQIGWDKLTTYDELTLMNDTCYFPIFPIEKYIDKFGDDEAIDFWGAYMHAAAPHGMPGTATVDYPGDPIPEHLQSYFITFKNDVLISGVFQDFWNNIEEYSNVDTVIREYETQLTSKLKTTGFKYDAIYKAHNNYLYLHPEKMLKQHFPFLKIKAVHYYNIKHIKRIIRKLGSEYSAQIITPIAEDKHLKLIIRSFLPGSVWDAIRWLRKNARYIWAVAVTLCVAYLIVRG